jgi:hypothetical protein
MSRKIRTFFKRKIDGTEERDDKYDKKNRGAKNGQR